VWVTIHDPALFATTVLAETLKANGITMTGKVARDRTARAELAKLVAGKETANPTDWQPIAAHETPLSQVLARANKDSMNLYAECLCKRLGFAVSGQSGSWENGTAAVGAFLKKTGVPEAEFSLDDGCGLSKQNHISPNAMVHVLMYDYFSGNRQAFFSSLSVAGSDGTLEARFTKGDLKGRVFGKSGFVKGVSSLSGYLEGHDGNWYAFSILMNGIPELSNSAIKPLQEAIVRAVDRNAGK
jgi:D-alanyl-D-alanine carboxypeptidase/D-alanyl-D-alanine-endopeptidase (penicillin-binding protein 4)